MISTQLKRASKQRNLREVFVNDEGAIDLASIMVGIIVIGIIGGVIAATVFAVIPWSQDNGAKQQLDSVRTAESAYRGLASDQGNNTYGDNAALSDGSYGKLLTLNDDAVTGVSISTPSNPDGSTDPYYIACIQSKTGTYFYTENGGATQSSPASTNPCDTSDSGGYGGGYGGGTSTPGNINTVDDNSYDLGPAATDPASSYYAGFINPGNGSNSDFTSNAADMNETSIDGNQELLWTDNNNANVNTQYRDLVAIAGGNDIPEWTTHGDYPNYGTFPSEKVFKFLDSSSGRVYTYVRADSVTFSDSNGQVGDTYTPATGSYLELIKMPDEYGGATQYAWAFKTIIPSDFSDPATALSDSNYSDLTATVVLNGQTITFHP